MLKPAYLFPLYYYFGPRSGDPLSSRERNTQTSVSASKTSRETVMDPDGDLNASIPKMKTIPETWPITSRRLFEVPSGAGWVISAPY